MPKPLLIALCSPAPGMGKSEVAKHLIAAHDFVPVKFAGPLKNMIRSLLTSASVHVALIERYVDGDLKEAVIPELGVTSRHLQKTLGTEWGRDLVRADLWVHLTRLATETLLQAGLSVVIDDMRFENELRLVRDLGGWSVRVTRPVAVPPEHRDGHRSEGGLDDHAMMPLINDGTIADLHLDVDKLIAALR